MAEPRFMRLTPLGAHTSLIQGPQGIKHAFGPAIADPQQGAHFDGVVQ